MARQSSAMGGVGLFVAAVLLAWTSSSSMIGVAYGALPDCQNEVTSMIGCLGYVTGAAAVPPPDCCSAVGTVLTNKPICLCELLIPGGTASTLPGFQPDLAKKLPTLCQLQGADPSLCNALINNGTSSPPPQVAPVAPPPASGSHASVHVGAALNFVLVAAVAIFFL